MLEKQRGDVFDNKTCVRKQIIPNSIMSTLPSSFPPQKVLNIKNTFLSWTYKQKWIKGVTASANNNT